MRRTVTVLQDDIDNGLRNQSHRCPIARALARDAELEDPGVSGDRAFYGPMGGTSERPYLHLPPECLGFVRSFDDGAAVEPFKFELEVPE